MNYAARLCLPILLAWISSGCSTNPPISVADQCPEPIPRGKPVEAMAGAPVSLATLPDDFGALPLEDALKTLLRAVTDDRGVYFELRRRHGELVRWIDAE